MKHLERASRSTIPNIYLYTWIRFCAWLSLSINSFLMIFLLEENSYLDKMYVKNNVYFIVMLVVGLISMTTVFGIRKSDRTVKNVIVDCVIVVFLSSDYVFGSLKIIPVFVIEIALIIFSSIKIHKDDSIVDNWKIVKWWRRKQKERLDKQVQKAAERNRKR